MHAFRSLLAIIFLSPLFPQIADAMNIRNATYEHPKQLAKEMNDEFQANFGWGFWVVAVFAIAFTMFCKMILDRRLDELAQLDRKKNIQNRDFRCAFEV